MHCVSWRNHAVATGHQGKGTTIRCSAPVSLLVALAAGIPAGEVGKVMIAGMGGVLGSVTIIIIWALCWGV